MYPIRALQIKAGYQLQQKTMLQQQWNPESLQTHGDWNNSLLYEKMGQDQN